MKISKKKILLGIPIILISWEIYLGILFGYLVAKLGGGKKTGQPGKVKSIVFNFGRYKLHFHHWFCGASVLGSILFFNFSIPFTQFSFGFFGGLIFQGIISYSDWYQILTKYNK